MNILTSQDITASLSQYGEVVLECSVHISRGIHECGNNTVMKYACALLNSGGGLLHMKNLDSDQLVQPKDLDTWWSGMESNMADILSGDDLCNYFDLVGNYDDRNLYLFVKSAEHLCTLDYHCRLPTDTATHEVSYRSAVKLLSRRGEPTSLADLPAIPTSFTWRQTEDTLKQEGKQIQFKYLTSGRDSHTKTLPDKIRYYCSKYLSAFANHEGGHIYFGIEDTTAAVFGEALTHWEEEKTVEKITNKMSGVIWGDEEFVPVRGRHWDVSFHNIADCRTRERRVLAVISVCKFPGGVFTACPESYFVDSQGAVQAFSFNQWKTAVLAEVRDKPELHARFMKIPLPTPQSRLVFGLSHTIPDIKNKVLPLCTTFNLHPKHLLDTVSLPKVKVAVQDILDTFMYDAHIALSIHSFAVGHCVSRSRDFAVELLVLSETYGLHLVSIADGLPKDKCQYYKHCRRVASQLKKMLVHHGGCMERLAVHVHIVNTEDSLYVQNFQLELDKTLYPPTFVVNATKLDHIMTSLIVSLASYSPRMANGNHDDYYFLLTSEQFELLWRHQLTRELWVHGPPGAGKTVAALQLIQEMRRRGCEQRQVMYIAENQLLCAYIRSFGCCEVVTRRELMQVAMDSDAFQNRFKVVRNVVVDEAQNFKDRDGDWYSLAESLANQNLDDKSDQTAGYFWVFMDYAQKVHKFKAGLPGLIGKNNFMLSEISRNSKEIFEYASKFMNLSSTSEEYVKDSPKLSHKDASGPGVSIVKCEKSSVEDTLLKVMRTCAEGGVKLEDMAVLLGKRTEAEEVQKHLEDKLQKDLGVRRVGSRAGQASDQHTEGGEPEINSDVEAIQSGKGSDRDKAKLDIDPEDIRGNSGIDSGLKEAKVGGNPDGFEEKLGKVSESGGEEVCHGYNGPSGEGPSIKGGSFASGSECAMEVSENEPSGGCGVTVDTVRRFSGLDKAVVIGLDPHINEEHADLDKFIVNLATRAKQGLVIITTSDELLKKLRS